MTMRRIRDNIYVAGQLAQLVEHILDVDGARGSSPLLSIKIMAVTAI